jgi:hypothetical protein
MVADFEAKASAAENFSFFIVEDGAGSRLYCPAVTLPLFPYDPSEVLI